ncbi:MAG: hypothetical protein AAGA48_37735 [Myxococcota bacterium]
MAAHSSVAYRHPTYTGTGRTWCDDDWEANEAALRHRRRLLSVYDVHGHTLWIVTESDRSATTVLLPNEY